MKGQRVSKLPWMNKNVCKASVFMSSYGQNMHLCRSPSLRGGKAHFQNGFFGSYMDAILELVRYTVCSLAILALDSVVHPQYSRNYAHWNYSIKEAIKIGL